MAFLRFPPEASAILIPKSDSACIRNLNSTLFELALPRAISTPEWPPLRPFAVTVYATKPLGAGSSLYFFVALISMPPAQPTQISFSSSESRFISISPLSRPFLSPKAPVIPVSSSIVNRASRGP